MKITLMYLAINAQEKYFTAWNAIHSLNETNFSSSCY